MSQELGSLRDEAVAFLNLGDLHYSRGNWAVAREYCEQALIISQSIDDTRTAGNVWHSLGLLWEETTDFEQAQLAFARALEIAQVHGIAKDEIVVLLSLGRWPCDRGIIQMQLSIRRTV